VLCGKAELGVPLHLHQAEGVSIKGVEGEGRILQRGADAMMQILNVGFHFVSRPPTCSLRGDRIRTVVAAPDEPPTVLANQRNHFLTSTSH